VPREYIELDLVADPDAMAAASFNFMLTAIPGYQSRPANPETVLLEANAQIGAEVIEQVAQVPPSLFAYYGTSFMGLPPYEGIPAQAIATLTFDADVAPLTIDTGWMVTAFNPNGDAITFQTIAAVDAPAGGGVKTVTVEALEPGADANGVYGLAEPVEVIDGLASVVLDTAVGGADEEDADEYLDRLADAMSILAPRPILAPDHAVMARQVPGVGRSTAIDLYQAGTNDNPIASSTLPGGTSSPVAPGAGVSGVERCVTTVITDEDGNAPGIPLKQSVYNLLDSQREVNFLIYVIGPQVSTVHVTLSVVRYAGYADADVIAAVQDSLTSWLTTQWGVPSGGTVGPEMWVNQKVIRIYEVIDWANRADGVNYVVDGSVRIAIGGGAMSATDLTLPGAAPQPTPGNLNVTVVPPS
jgi:hypothetical protein